MVTYLGLLVQLCCGETGTLQTNITGVCGECSQCLGHTGFAPAHGKLQVALQGNCLKQALGCLHFPSLSCSGSGFLGAPQRHRLSWACVLCRFQVQAAQVTWCLVSALSPGGWCILSPPWSWPQREHRLRCAMCLLWGVDLWL